MSKSIVIVTSDRENIGAVSLEASAKSCGLDARLAIIHEDDVVALVNASDGAIFRINPTTYSFYVSIQNDVDARYTEQIQGSIAAFDKAATYDILVKNNIPTPTGHLISRGERLTLFPVVIKVLHGNQGNGVALLRNEADFDAFVSEYNEQSYFVQDFIEKATGHDKRLLIAGGQLMGAMERRSDSDFRANLHQGGKAAAYTPTAREIELAQHAAHAFGLDLAGVDIIDGNDGPLVLEVNPSPGLQIGEIIGINVAEKIIKELFHD